MLDIKKIPLITFIFSSLAVCAANGEDVYYTIREGDTLSNIVEEQFPMDYIYGKNRRLDKLIKLNRSILKNPNSIRPGLVVRLGERSEMEKIAYLPSPMTLPEIATVEIPIAPSEAQRAPASATNDEWIMSLAYGAHFTSVSQQGAQGKAEIGAISANHLRVKSEFTSDNISGWVSYDNYKFNFKSTGFQDSTSLSCIDLGASYYWLQASLGVEESPLIKAQGSTVTMINESVIYASVGAKKSVSLNTRKPTSFNMSATIRYPLKVQTDTMGVDLSGVSGFSLIVRSELSREISHNENYSINLYWSNDVAYKKMSQQTVWGAHSGKVNLDKIDISSLLGLSFKF